MAATVRFSVLGSRFSSLKPQASSLKPQASSLKPQASSLKPQASGLKPQASSLGPRASGLGPPTTGSFLATLLPMETTLPGSRGTGQRIARPHRLRDLRAVARNRFSSRGSPAIGGGRTAAGSRWSLALLRTPRGGRSAWPCRARTSARSGRLELSSCSAPACRPCTEPA